MELLPDGATEERLWKLCKKNPAHKNFIPVSEFCIEHLPEPYRSQEYFDFVKALADITVRLRVKCTSRNRPGNDHFSTLRGKTLTRAGTGFLTDLIPYCHKALTDNLFFGFLVDENNTNFQTKVGEPHFDFRKISDVMKKIALESGCDPDTARLFDRKELFPILYKIFEKCCELVSKENVSSADIEQFMFELPHEISDSDQCNFSLDCSLDLLNNVNTMVDSFFDKRSPLSSAIKKGLDMINPIDHKQVAHPEDDNHDTVCEPDETDEMLDPSFVRKVHPCPCPDCKQSPERTGYLLGILTAKHVIFNDEEAQKTTVDLFCDDIKEANVEHLHGCRILLGDNETDCVVLECVTHNLHVVFWLQEMYRKLKEVRKYCESELVWGTLFNPPLAVICSHPHGYFKHITVGEWTQRVSYRCQALKKSPCFTRYMYTTPTCSGSSGAPVLILGHKDYKVIMKSPFHAHFGHLNGNNYSGIYHSVNIFDEITM